MKCKSSSFKVFATETKKGSCNQHKEGDSFPLTGFTPKGLCDSAYAVLSEMPWLFTIWCQTTLANKRAYLANPLP